MEVTQSAEHVTHALVGSRETIDMGVAETAAFFTMMSSTLYSDQKLACVREVLCNAWDAHIDSGRTDTPLEITLTDDQMIIRDFGHGIPHNMIGPIYGVYGQSTKAKDEKSTGGFGLGSKAPFAYTEHFRVISAHEGVRTVYQMSKSSSEVEGKPSIDVIVSTPTTSSGLTVIIDINHNDFIKFEELIKGVVANGEMLADLNEERLSVLPFSKAEHGFLLTSEKPLHAMGLINIRYGTVVYPLEPSTEISDVYHDVLNFINSLGTSYRHSQKQLRLVLQAPPNTLTVTPSRETLSMQKHTIDTVRKLLRNFNNLVLDKIEPACDPIIHDLTSKFYKLYPEKATTNRELIDSTLFEHMIAGDESTANQNVNIYTPTSVSKQLVARRRVLTPNQNKKLYLQKLKALMPKLEPGMLGAAQNLYSAVRKASPDLLSNTDNYFIPSNYSWLKQQVIFPLLEAMKTTSLSTKRLNINDSVFDDWVRARRENTKQQSTRNVLRDTSMSLIDSLPYLEPIVVITHNQRDCIDAMGRLYRSLPDTSYRNNIHECLHNERPYFFYTIPRNTDLLKEAKEFFAKTPFTVYDVTRYQSTAANPIRVKTVSSKPKVNRRAGYARLDGMKQDGYINTLFTQTDDAPRIKEPSFFVPINTKREENLLSVPGLSTSMAHYLIDNYGTEGALAVTDRQQEKCREVGIPHMKTFLAHKLYDQVMQNKAVLQYLANTDYLENKLTQVLNYDETRVVKIILGDHILAKKHGINMPDLSNDELLLAERWKHFMHFMRNAEEVLKAYHAKLKPSKRLIKLVQLVNKNNVIKTLEALTLRSYLTSSNTDLNELARHILTTLLRKGKSFDEPN